METSDAEKRWLKHMKETAGTHVPEERPVKDDRTVVRQPVRKGKGFEDIAGMAELKQFVNESFINVIRYRNYADAYGIRPPSMLFYGPAGCGKTFFAEKMAEEVGINFMKIVPDDIACTWVHGTQQKIGEVFRKAERAAPTLLFFDEFDAMVSKRSGNEANQHYDSEVNEFLCKLNNASERGIYVLAATNHPERIDRAVLRTGRIDEMIYIDMPDAEARKSLFALELSRLPKEEAVDTVRLAALTEGYNCSDITYIVKSAARKVFNETIKNDNGRLVEISQALLEDSISCRRPSVSSRDLREYERVRNEFSPKDKGGMHMAIGFR